MGNLSPNTAQTGTLIQPQVPGGKPVMAADVMLQGPLGPLGSQANPLVTSDLTEVSTKAGQSFFGSSSVMTLALAGNIRMLLSNPANSGVNAILKSIVTLSNAAAPMSGTLFQNPTAGLPSIAIPLANMMLGGPAPVSSLMADNNTTAMTAGTGVKVSPFGIPTGRTVFSQSPIVIPPGMTLGLNLAFTVGASGEVAFYFTEQSTALFVAS